MPNNINKQITRLKGIVVKQMVQGLKAKDGNLTSVKLAARGLKSEHGPWVVAQSITPALFKIWSVRSVKQASRWKIAYEDEEGAVLLYGDPLCA